LTATGYGGQGRIRVMNGAPALAHGAVVHKGAAPDVMDHVITVVNDSAAGGIQP